MRKWILAAAALLAVETAAIACSCMATDDPVELRRFAADTAKEAIAVVEAEAVTAFEGAGKGEHIRVLRTLAGSAPGEFRIARGPMPSSASCDVLYRVGERATIILYPAVTPTANLPVHRTSGLCTVHLLDKPVFRDALIDALNRPGERG